MIVEPFDKERHFLLLFIASLGACAGSIQLGPGAYAAAADSGFTVNVSLSPQAASRLAQLAEPITMSALYYGEPTRAARRHADEMGQIDLGTDEMTIPGSGGAAQFTLRALDRKHVVWGRNKDVKLNINVYTARHSDPNNLIACDFFDDSLSLALAHPINVGCKLIGEN